MTLICLTVLFAAALFADSIVAIQMRDTGTAAWLQGHRKCADVLKFPGTFYAALAAAAVIWARYRRPILSMFVILSGILSGSNFVLKWIAGQYRPFKPDGVQVPQPWQFHPFWQGFYGLFHETNLAFPSGHACEAFALAAALLMLFPRAGWCAVVIAAITTVERIAENAHYTSDAVLGVIVGIIAALVARRVTPALLRLFRRWGSGERLSRPPGVSDQQT